MPPDPGPEAPLPAGDFSDWLRQMRTALAGEGEMNVACGDCVGCCTSSYYIKVRAHEHAAIAAIGAAHLAPAPGARDGALMMGYDERGHCAMFGPGGCAIYAHRPETCRIYDCRVYAATGLEAGEGKTAINARIARWRFSYPQPQDAAEQRAVAAAASFLRQHPVRFPSGRIPSRPAEIAVLAVKTYTVFLEPPGDDAGIAQAIVRASGEFDRAAERPT